MERHTIEPKVWTFFYGSYINLKVLKKVNLVPEKWEVVRLCGFDLVIRPRANLVRTDRGIVYGIVAASSHAELNRLYAHARDVLGETYLPEAVLTETLDGRWKPALCYICPTMEPRRPEAAYVDQIADPAREFGFPAWYIDKIESFRL